MTNPSDTTLKNGSLSNTQICVLCLQKTNLLCLQKTNLLCLQTRHLARHLLCPQTRHQLCQQTRHLWSPKTSQCYGEHRGPPSAAPCVVNRKGMSWETTDVLSADTTDVSSADTTDVLPADTTDVLSADTTGLSAANARFPKPRFGILEGANWIALSNGCHGRLTGDFFGSRTPPLWRRQLWGWLGPGRGFARPTLDFKPGVWVLVWLLLPSNIGLGLLAGGGSRRPRNSKYLSKELFP